MNIEKGDFVTSKSHNNDIIFKVISISEDTVYLKGVYDRLYADSDIFDLVKTDVVKNEYETHAYISSQVERFGELTGIAIIPMIDKLIDAINNVANAFFMLTTSQIILLVKRFT